MTSRTSLGRVLALGALGAFMCVACGSDGASSTGGPGNGTGATDAGISTNSAGGDGAGGSGAGGSGAGSGGLGDGAGGASSGGDGQGGGGQGGETSDAGNPCAVTGTCPPTTVDEDGDGDPAETDCDDQDPARYHGAKEKCDAVDDDCDPTTLGPDGDKDGVSGTECCNPTEGGSSCGTDCDDTNAKVKPSAKETCNGVDDDCDGTVDVPPTGADPLCSVTGQTCTSGSCQCAQGQTVCGASCTTLGGACSTGTGACVSSGTIACVSGAPACNAVVGNPGTEVCDGVDNNCDGSIDEGTKISCYPDGDNDGYATNTAASDVCPDSSRPSFGNCPLGYVAPGVSAGVDCNPSDPGQYRLLSTTADADGDGRCAGGATSSCVGTSPPAGRRFTETCVGSDCDDGNGGIYQTVNVRTDSDGDGFCVGGGYDVCTSGGAPGGTRVSGSCQGSDCNDSNGYATSTCSIDSGFISNSVRKICNIGPPPAETFGVGTAVDCPTGFSPVSLRTEVNSSSLPGGNCSANGIDSVTVRCGGVVLGYVDCRIVADCAAN